MFDSVAQPQAEFRHVPVAGLQFSKSTAQAERRKHFDQAALKELAANIKEQGIVQPIVVRELDDGVLEVVAGERRVLGARKAGIATVPAMVRKLDDMQALDVQLIENLQREDLHELAEAEGFEVLLRSGMSPDEIADKVAKSKSHVYARMKLIELGAAGREAFYKSEINASVALLIARIPGDELQERALKRITEIDPYHKEPMSYREVLRYVQDEFTLKLSGAPFPREDLLLVPAAGACSACPKRSGNQPADLFGDIKSADVCTDPPCFKAKRDAFQKRELENAKATGTKVIPARQARSIIPSDRGYYHSSDGMHKNLKKGFARPSDKCPDDPKKRTYAELAGKDAPTVLIQNPDNGRVFKAFEIEAIKDRLEAKGVKPKPPAADPAEQREHDRAKQEKHQAEQLACDIAVFQAVYAAAPKKLEREDLIRCALAYLQGCGGEDSPRFQAFGWPVPKGKTYMNSDDWRRQLEKLTEVELIRVIVVLPALDDVIDNYRGRTPELDELAKRFGIDAKKIRKETKGAAAPAEKPKAEEKPKSKKKSKGKK